MPDDTCSTATLPDAHGADVPAALPPVAIDPAPVEATPPPAPKPPHSFTPKSGYLPRAFGFGHESLFVEVTLYKDPRNAQMLNADGRFISDDETDTGRQEWTHFETLDELIAKAGWSGEQAGRFTARITELLKAR